MNISYRWLKELAPTIQESAADLAERLTFTAVPVEEAIYLGEGLQELVVGRVQNVAPHPRADRLVICQVDVGRGEPVQVVTGAPVVVEGGFYPYVGDGQTLPGGQMVKRVKLRGEYSEGMLCSERELGVGRDQSGIMQLIGDFEPGQSVIDALGLDDYRLAVEVTPNRPDLLGHRGVAREVAPGGEPDLRLPDFPEQRRAERSVTTAKKEGQTAGVTVRIEDAKGCPRYMGAVIRGVSVKPSPAWLANRLRAVGLQPINNVVDATNYVLYELNQPLHAFDLAKLKGPAVIIRRARPGELLRTLDGKNRTLGPEILVIADAEVPCAVAGVMGGEAAEVSEATRDVFLECAYFDPRRVRQAARVLGLDTDASYRFQRGVDPEGLPAATHRVLDLILTLAGGELEGGAVDVNPAPAPRRVTTLRPSRVSQVLGIELDGPTIEACLRPLAFELQAEGENSFTVGVPSWRPDVEREVDLIEEVARRYGYGEFPDELRSYRPGLLAEDSYADVSQSVRRLMTSLGFLETLTVPFVPGDEGDVRLLNPLSEREDHLRTDLLSSLLHRVEYNFARGLRDVRLFEIGTVFAAGAGRLPEERIRVAAAWTGLRQPAHWSGGDGDWDVWDLKWITASLAQLAALGAEARPVDDDGQSLPFGLQDALAVVAGDGRALGWSGRVAAERVESPRWAGPVWGLEMDMVPGRRDPLSYRALPVYPAIERDLALVVPKAKLAAEVGEVIREASPDTLERLWVFDVYEGENIPAGSRSVAWRLRFRASDRTLTDDEVDAAVKRITSALEERLDVGIRGT